MLTTAPYVAIAVGAKLGLHVAGFAGLVDFSDVGLVLGGGVFLIGFMLAGTMADFKESERLPGEAACCLETLEETFAQAAIGRPALDGPRMRRTVLEVVEDVLRWMRGRVRAPSVFASIDRLRDVAQELERGGAGPYAGRSLNEIHALRRHLTRVHVISRTGFLPSGYALLEALTAAIFVLLGVSKFKNWISEAALVAFVVLIYVYMLRLIRDIDDPFEHAEDGVAGAAEVDLCPLVELRDRVAARVAAEAGSNARDAAA
jgi:hypothetical protein